MCAVVLGLPIACAVLMMCADRPLVGSGRQGSCRQCDYSLEGLAQGAVCPECGTEDPGARFESRDYTTDLHRVLLAGCAVLAMVFSSSVSAVTEDVLEASGFRLHDSLRGQGIAPLVVVTALLLEFCAFQWVAFRQLPIAEAARNTGLYCATVLGASVLGAVRAVMYPSSLRPAAMALLIVMVAVGVLVVAIGCARLRKERRTVRPPPGPEG